MEPSYWPGKRKEIMKITKVMAFFSILCVTSLFGSFENTDLSSESVKLSDATASLFLGAENIYNNPAGLSDLKKRQIGLLYSKMMLNLEDDDLNYLDFVVGYPFKGFVSALSFNRFSSRLYFEQVFSLGGAVRLLNTFDRTISLGFRAKLLQIGYVQNDYTALDSLFIKNGYNKFGLSVDMGLLYETKAGFNAGLSVKNINPPIMTLDQSGNGLPFMLDAGISYLFDFQQTQSPGFIKTLLLAFDAGLKNEDFSAHFGIEAGIGSGEILPGAGFVVGSGELSYISAGVSYRPKGFSAGSFLDHLGTLSYAFRFHLGGMYLGTYGDHFISMSFWF
jgi:hypothetical protein